MKGPFKGIIIIKIIKSVSFGGHKPMK